MVTSLYSPEDLTRGCHDDHTDHRCHDNHGAGCTCEMKMSVVPSEVGCMRCTPVTCLTCVRCEGERTGRSQGCHSGYRGDGMVRGDRTAHTRVSHRHTPSTTCTSTCTHFLSHTYTKPQVTMATMQTYHHGNASPDLQVVPSDRPGRGPVKHGDPVPSPTQGYTRTPLPWQQRRWGTAVGWLSGLYTCVLLVLVCGGTVRGVVGVSSDEYPDYSGGLYDDPPIHPAYEPSEPPGHPAYTPPGPPVHPAYRDEDPTTTQPRYRQRRPYTTHSDSLHTRIPDNRTPDSRTPDNRTPDSRTLDSRTPDTRTLGRIPGVGPYDHTDYRPEPSVYPRPSSYHPPHTRPGEGEEPWDRATPEGWRDDLHPHIDPTRYEEDTTYGQESNPGQPPPFSPPSNPATDFVHALNPDPGPSMTSDMTPDPHDLVHDLQTTPMLRPDLSHDSDTDMNSDHVIDPIVDPTRMYITECPLGRYGVNCMKECHCADADEACEPAGGSCRSGCDPRWMGAGCQGMLPTTTTITITIMYYSHSYHILLHIRYTLPEHDD